MLLNSQIIIPLTIESVAGDSPEITNPGQCHVNQSVQKLIHHSPMESDFASYGHSLAELEVGNRLFCPGHNRLLSGYC